MINIVLNNNYLEVTSDSHFSFPFQDGKVSFPVNSIFYKVDTHSNYITFRSIASGDVLFAGDYTQIKINDAIPEDFFEAFNAIAFK